MCNNAERKMDPIVESLTKEELVKMKGMISHYLEIQEFTNMEYLAGQDLLDLMEEIRFFSELSPKLDRIIGGMK